MGHYVKIFVFHGFRKNEAATAGNRSAACQVHWPGSLTVGNVNLQFAEGEWAGVELDQADGKNDGSVQNVRYFDWYVLSLHQNSGFAFQNLPLLSRFFEIPKQYARVYGSI